VILNSGLAVDYEVVSVEAEKLRLAMTRADAMEIDFTVENGPDMTVRLELNQQEAQKSHGLCQGDTPDIANLPAGEVYFVPTGAEGTFPLKYEDGTLGKLTVTGGCIIKAELIAGKQSTIDEHNANRFHFINLDGSKYLSSKHCSCAMFICCNGRKYWFG
jgi:leucyl aminopeptidase (aminopeptidase T)